MRIADVSAIAYDLIYVPKPTRFLPQAAKRKKPTSAQLCKHQDCNYYIHIQIEDEPPTPKESDNVIGVDFGERDIAVTSNDDNWDGEKINGSIPRQVKSLLN